MLLCYRDETLHQVSTLKRQNDDLLMNTVQLEGQLNKSKQKIFGTEEQLRKLEHKVSVSDVNVANQVGPAIIKKLIFKSLRYNQCYFTC